MNNREQLLQIASVYLDENLDFKELTNATQSYKKLLETVTGADLNTDTGRQHVSNANGIAIGTYWAALCLDDFMRTRQFIRGIHVAIEEKLQQQQDTLHIMYAGTGPYATLLLPLIFKYPKERIRYTFMEINAFTYNIMQTVLAGVGLEDYNIETVLTDACTYVIEDGNKPDIIISETMQNALANEHQVPIFFNLMHQAKADTVFIPEKIEIYWGLKQSGVPLLELTKVHYHQVKKILEVSKEAMFSLIQNPNALQEGQPFGEEQTIIEAQDQEGYTELLLLTEIQVYKQERLEVKQSGLTLPKIVLHDLSTSTQKLMIKSHYKISEKPTLEYEIATTKLLYSTLVK